jgi:phosphatidylinositol dimannoside acyltransferase
VTQAATRTIEAEAQPMRRPVDGVGLRMGAAQFWIQALVALSHRAPGVARAIRPLGLWFTWHCSGYLRGATRANAARIAAFCRDEGDQAGIHPDVLATRMVATFYDFLADMGRHRGRPAESLLEEIQGTEGVEGYHRARAAGKGAIIVTAHIGSFEVGAAAVRKREPRVHIVFQRDPIRLFERMRAEQRRQLGLIEAPVDPATGQDTWNVWLKLRDALRDDQVVLLQGDRVMPGQRGRRVPFMGGHVMLPPGPVKLALATGAPIVPVCAPRMANGQVRIIMDEPIWVEPHEGNEPGPHPAEMQLAKVIEGWVKRFPDQWMMVHKAWCEDRRLP